MSVEQLYYRKGDSILSKFGTKSNLLKALDVPPPGTGLVLKQSSPLKSQDSMLANPGNLAQVKRDGELRHTGSRSRTIKALP